jgi:hypothetical protein
LELNLYLDASYLFDGIYDKITVGNVVAFAVEIRMRSAPTLAEVSVPSMEHMSGPDYYIRAKRFSNPETDEFLIFTDLGFFAYSENRVEDPLFIVPIGAGFEGKAFLGLAPTKPQLPIISKLVYTWRIVRIQLETSPRVEMIDDAGCKVMAKDPARFQYRDVEVTDPYNDGDILAEYLLTCQIVLGPTVA